MPAYSSAVAVVPLANLEVVFAEDDAWHDQVVRGPKRNLDGR